MQRALRPKGHPIPRSVLDLYLPLAVTNKARQQGTVFECGQSRGRCQYEFDAPHVCADGFIAELLAESEFPSHSDLARNISRDENHALADIHYAFVSDNRIRLQS